MGNHNDSEFFETLWAKTTQANEAGREIPKLPDWIWERLDMDGEQSPDDVEACTIAVSSESVPDAHELSELDLLPGNIDRWCDIADGAEPTAAEVEEILSAQRQWISEQLGGTHGVPGECARVWYQLCYESPMSDDRVVISVWEKDGGTSLIGLYAGYEAFERFNGDLIEDSADWQTHDSQVTDLHSRDTESRNHG